MSKWLYVMVLIAPLFAVACEDKDANKSGGGGGTPPAGSTTK